MQAREPRSAPARPLPGRRPRHLRALLSTAAPVTAPRPPCHRDTVSSLPPGCCPAPVALRRPRGSLHGQRSVSSQHLPPAAVITDPSCPRWRATCPGLPRGSLLLSSQCRDRSLQVVGQNRQDGRLLSPAAPGSGRAFLGPSTLPLSLSASRAALAGGTAPPPGLLAGGGIWGDPQFPAALRARCTGRHADSGRRVPSCYLP